MNGYSIRKAAVGIGAIPNKSTMKSSPTNSHTLLKVAARTLKNLPRSSFGVMDPGPKFLFMMSTKLLVKTPGLRPGLTK